MIASIILSLFLLGNCLYLSIGVQKQNLLTKAFFTILFLLHFTLESKSNIILYYSPYANKEDGIMATCLHSQQAIQTTNSEIRPLSLHMAQFVWPVCWHMGPCHRLAWILPQLGSVCVQQNSYKWETLRGGWHASAQSTDRPSGKET